MCLECDKRFWFWRWHKLAYEVKKYKSIYNKAYKHHMFSLDIIGYWVIGTRCQIKKDLGKVSVLKRWKDLCSEDFWKLFPLFIPISWPGLSTVWVVAQKIYSKMHPAFCTNTHHDVTDLLNYVLVKNTKTWIPWELNITFLRNKKHLNLWR